MKLLFVASSGGHFEELMCLRPLMDKYESILITEAGGQAEDSRGPVDYIFPQINRKEKGFFRAFLTLCRSVKDILKKEKPDVIISTGALLSFPFCLFGKIYRKKVVYIESFARIDNLSLTGRLVYFFADMFLVQWHNLALKYHRARYVGSIF